jgi:hypothetical protein
MKVRVAGGESPIRNYEVTSLAKNNFRLVTVNMYNPHVKDEEVRAFLGRFYGECVFGKAPQGLPGVLDWEEVFSGTPQGGPRGVGRLPPSSSVVLPGG